MIRKFAREPYPEPLPGSMLLTNNALSELIISVIEHENNVVVTYLGAGSEMDVHTYATKYGPGSFPSGVSSSMMIFVG